MSVRQINPKMAARCAGLGFEPWISACMRACTDQLDYEADRDRYRYAANLNMCYTYRFARSNPSRRTAI